MWLEAETQKAEGERKTRNQVVSQRTSHRDSVTGEGRACQGRDAWQESAYQREARVRERTRDREDACQGGQREREEGPVTGGTRAREEARVRGGPGDGEDR